MDISGYTSAQIREIPELAHLYKAVLFMEKNKGKILFPEKYQASMIDRAQEKTIKFFNEQPKMPIKDAIVAILGSFTMDIPDFALLKMTEEIIKTHQKLSKNVFQERHVLETA